MRPLNPGQVTLLPAVHDALAAPDLCLARSSSSICRMPSAGLAAVEAVMVSMSGDGAPGAAFVLARRSALAKAKSAAAVSGSDQLLRQVGRARHAFHALPVAVVEHAGAGGWRARHAHYRVLHCASPTGGRFTVSSPRYRRNTVRVF